MKKVLIFPGAFNPPHYGHVFALQKALEDSHFDEVWIIPSGKREDKDISISYEDRRALNKLFVDYLNKNLKVLCKLRTDELDNIEGKYTSEILAKIKSESGTELAQLIGTDGYMFLRNQIPPDEFKKERFIVVSRGGYELTRNVELDENNVFIHVNSEEISSTQLRSMVMNGDSEYQKLTLPDIAFYIKEHKLYS